LRSWYDKELQREFASQNGAWRLGQYVYEWVDHPDDRRAIFALDFNREDFGVRHTDTPFRRQGPAHVEIMPTHIDPSGAHLGVRLHAPGARCVQVRYTLPHDEKALHIDMVVDKEHITTAEAIYIMFPLELAHPRFHLDLNGVALEPEHEQLPGSCRDWYGIQRWAEVNDGAVSVTMVPLDSPLIQVGGITTGRWAEHLDAREATLVSWALHNHWDTNFKASQGEAILLRYRLTSRRGYDGAASSRFAIETTIPPLIVRVPGAALGARGQFLSMSPEGVAEVQLKRAADQRGLIIHAYNLTTTEQRIALRFAALNVTQAWLCSPIEDDREQLVVVDNSVELLLPGRGVACARIVIGVAV
jgi:hypothetical protein